MIRDFHYSYGSMPAVLQYICRTDVLSVVKDMTPEEAFTGVRPHVDHLRIFGCVTFSHVPKDLRRKLDPTAETGLLVGYSKTVKAYQIYLPHSSTVVVRRDVRFEEEKAFTRSREYEELLTPEAQQQQQQVVQVQVPSTGESGGTGGGSAGSVVTGSPVVSSQMGS